MAELWIPAFAGMTGGEAGMTKGEAGMTRGAERTRDVESTRDVRVTGVLMSAGKVGRRWSVERRRDSGGAGNSLIGTRHRCSPFIRLQKSIGRIGVLHQVDFAEFRGL
jgi:hypothetical protein